MNKKIKNSQELKKIVTDSKKSSKKSVLCHGTFDLVHLGHVKHFEDAKKLGDILIVSVTSDEFVFKGPNRPKFKIRQRMEMLSNIQLIDYVIESKSVSAIPIIKKIKPNIYCKGPDYKNHSNDISNNISKEVAAIKSVKGKIMYTKSDTFSSSELLNIYDESISNEQKVYLELVKKLTNDNKIKNYFEKISNKKVLIIGETIIDEYVFCDAIGKSGKEPVLVIQDKSKDKYLGGAGAVANNVSNFTNNVSYLSFLGKQKNQESFVMKSLSKNIKKKFFYKEDSPTINKKRYIDKVSNSKILGVYSMNDEALSSKNEKNLYNWINKHVSKFDAVIVTDYGHGMISQNIANLICKKSKYLAVNSQINASNSSYQNINKYKNFDLLVINEGELRHELRDRSSTKEYLAQIIKNKIVVKKALITSGSDGAMMLLDNNEIIYSPAFAKKIVDKIGAGDSMLSILALCDVCSIKNEISILLGSLAAAQSVESIGNSRPINKLQLTKALQYILK